MLRHKAPQGIQTKDWRQFSKITFQLDAGGCCIFWWPNLDHECSRIRHNHCLYDIDSLKLAYFEKAGSMTVQRWFWNPELVAIPYGHCVNFSLLNSEIQLISFVGRYFMHIIRFMCSWNPRTTGLYQSLCRNCCGSHKFSWSQLRTKFTPNFIFLCRQ